MDQTDIINKLIPADDLYWDDAENKFIALSENEINSILTAAIDSGYTEEDDILKIFNWCTSVRVGQLLMKNFIYGNIAISEICNDGEPRFVHNSNGNF